MFNILSKKGTYKFCSDRNCLDINCRDGQSSDTISDITLSQVDSDASTYCPDQLNAVPDVATLQAVSTPPEIDKQMPRKASVNARPQPFKKLTDQVSQVNTTPSSLSFNGASQGEVDTTIPSNPSKKAQLLDSEDRRSQTMPIWFSVSTYFVSVLLLLQFLSCIHPPVWATVLMGVTWTLLYAGHTALRDFSSARSPVYVQTFLLDTARLKQRILPFKAWKLANCFYQVLLCMRFVYVQFRHAVVCTSAVVDQLCQLGFLTLHGAFEGAVPANGALLGLQNPFFALFSCLVAGGVEIAGEHNPLFTSDQSCCASSISFGFGVGYWLLLLPVFLGNLLFSAVVFLECMPLLLAFMPTFPWWLSQSGLVYALTTGLSLSYATVFTLILTTLPAKMSRLSFCSSHVVLCVLSILSAGIWFFEFYAHIALLSSLPVAIALATATALSRALLFFLTITVTHMCGGSLDLGKFNWMKSSAAWAGGIIAGFEVFEFLGSFSGPISSLTLFVVVGMAVYSAVVVEGAFFGADSKTLTSDDESHPRGSVFTSLSSLLLPQKLSWPGVVLSSFAAVAVSMQGASGLLSLSLGLCLLGVSQKFLDAMIKSTSRVGFKLSCGVDYAPGVVSPDFLDNKRHDVNIPSRVDQGKFSFLSYCEHLSGNPRQASSDKVYPTLG